MRSVLVVVLLVVLAGCSGVLPQDSPEQGSEQTVTAAEIPTGGDAPGLDVVAPGVNERHVEDVYALTRAHRERLTSESFTAHSTLVATGPNETLVRENRTLRADLSRPAYWTVQYRENHPSYPVRSIAPEVELWHERTTTFIRVVDGDEVSYGAQRNTGVFGPLSDITQHDRLVVLLSAFELRVEPGDPGPGRTRLVATNTSRQTVVRPPTLMDEPRNVSFEAVVTSDGVVVSFRLAYDATYRSVGTGSRRVRVVETFDVTAIGETRVERPEWYEAAAAAGGGSTGATPYEE